MATERDVAHRSRQDSSPSRARRLALCAGATRPWPPPPRRRHRQTIIAAREGVAADAVPADAVTASASGADPHISPAYAELQVPRVARVTRLPETDVRRLVEEHTDGRFLGFLGEPGVNVTELNLAVRAAR